MTIYTTATSAAATHTIELYAQTAPGAVGIDLALFEGGGVELDDGIWEWLRANGLDIDDPDIWGLVCPVGEGEDQRPFAILPIAPVA